MSQTANASFLWPVFHEVSSDYPIRTPPFKIITSATASSVGAEILYEQDFKQCSFIWASPAANHRHAYEKLLALTDRLVQKNRKHFAESSGFLSGLRNWEAGPMGGYRSNQR